MVALKKRNINKILNLAHIFLKINGIFLEGKTTCIPIINATCGLFFSGTYFIFCVIGLFVYWESIESLYRAQGIPLSIKVFLCLIIILYKQNDWVHLLRRVKLLDLHEQLEEEERKEMDATIKFYTKFSMIYTAQMIGCVVFFYFSAMLKLTVPLPLYTFCDLDILECYIPYIIYEIFMDIFMIPFPLSLNLLFIYIVLAIICQIEAIKCSLRKIDVHTKMEEMRVIINQHDEVCLIVDEFRNTAQNLFLVMYLASMLLVCVVFYMINRSGFPPDMDDVTVYLPFALTFMLEFYIYAFGATKLSNTIDSVADEVYNTNWPENPDVQKCLVLMIQKCQNTKGLTIGGLLILDLQVFIKFMQNAFSFYTVMNNLGDKEV